jgi:hypothetical protein
VDGDRAWAMIGPYGSGKSSLGSALRSLTSGISERAQALLNELALVDPTTFNAVCDSGFVGGFWCIAFEADSKTGIERQVLAATRNQIVHANGSSALLDELNNLLGQPGVPNRAVTRLLRAAAREASNQGKHGLLVIVDEFGRLLEQDPRRISETLGFVQNLAELANSTRTETIHFLVLLHQNFRDYAPRFGRSRLADWAKVQGRFRQINFHSDPDELYDLLAGLIQVDPQLEGRVSQWAETQAMAATRIAPETDWKRITSVAYPLHAVAAYALPRLSAVLGQNERTMHAFLASTEPKSLASYLARTELTGDSLPCLTVDWLFDYFVSTQGMLATPSPLQRSVTQAMTALECLTDGGGIETRAVKVIALLQMLADQNLKPTADLIALALDVQDDRSQALAEALQRLASERILVRRPDKTYALHPGSAIDVEDLIERSLAEQTGFDPDQVLLKTVALDPLVARRHTYQFGTTRVFGQRVTSVHGFVPRETPQSWREANGSVDGLVTYLLATDDEELAKAHQLARANTDPLHILVVPDNPIPASELLHNASVLHELLSGSASPLERDPAAQHEVALRLEWAKEELRRELAPLLTPSDTASWCLPAGVSRPTSLREVQAIVSDLADASFSKTPVVRNELINRRKLSSAAVVGVKKIVQPMLAGESHRDLELRGNGPEVSIFRALFENSTIVGSGPEFVLKRPTGDWRPVWESACTFIESSQTTPKAIAELWNELALPPFGLRSGILPLFTWMVLVSHRTGLCLYEKGTFQPSWHLELYDRLARWPEEFQVRWISVRGWQAELIQTYWESLDPSRAHSSKGTLHLNEFLSALFGWFRRIPDYAKRTQNVSEAARGLREALSRASDPVELLTVEIPAALGEAGLVETHDARRLKGVARQFESAVDELSSLYPSLLARVCEVQANAFGVSATDADIRRAYGEVAAEIQGYKLTERAAALLVRGSDLTLPFEEWCESIGALVIGTPPRTWLDSDATYFEEQARVLLGDIAEARDTRRILGARPDGYEVPGTRITVRTNRGVLADVVTRQDLSPGGTKLLPEAVEAFKRITQSTDQDDKYLLLGELLKRVKGGNL